MELVYEDGQAASSSFMDSGVRFKSIQFDDSRWDFVELPGELFNADFSRNWFLIHLGKKYDFAGLIRFAIGAIPERKRKFFCSEACLASLGINEPWRFTPNAAHALLTSMIKSRQNV